LLAGRGDEAMLDAWIFSTDVNPVRDVMVGGRWVIRERQHPQEEAIMTAFKRAMRRLAG
ncbi:MAG: formimidoylglutamate deiminase, partial [Methylobacteriaceae bacterium]|nr:formimidoylglutamate deiminase [Methylobacteriaceae bacterium]